jgi:hypothetical protein
VNWRGILKSLSSDCDMNLRPQFFERVSFNDRSLSAFVKKYNGCIGGYQVDDKEDVVRYKVQSGLVFSVGMQNLRKRIKTPTSQYNYISSNNAAVRFAAGMPIQISSSDPKYRTFIQTGLFFSDFSYKSSYVDYRIDITSEYEYSFSMSHLSIPFSIFYTFPKGKVTPYIQLGSVLNALLRSEASTQQIDNFTTGSFVMTSVPFTYKNVVPSLQIGAGIIRCQGRFSTRTGIQLEWMQNITDKSRLALIPLHLGLVFQVGLAN